MKKLLALILLVGSVASAQVFTKARVDTLSSRTPSGNVIVDDSLVIDGTVTIGTSLVRSAAHIESTSVVRKSDSATYPGYATLTALAAKATTSSLGSAAYMDSTTLRVFVNVKDHGATGDGVTDDYASVVSAVAQAKTLGKRVLFPSGEYLLGSDLAISDSGIVLEGEFPRAFHSATETYASKGARIIGHIVFSGAGNELRNITVSNTGEVVFSSGVNSAIDNCILVGPDAQTQAHGLLLTGSGHRVSNVSVYNIYHGIAVRASDVRLDNIYAQDCGLDGIIIKSGSGESNKNITVNNYTFRTLYDTTSSAVFIHLDEGALSLENVIINGFHSDSTGSGAVVIWADSVVASNMRGIVVANGSVKKSTSAIWSYWGQNTSVIGVSADSLTSSAFVVWNSRTTSFTGCNAGDVTAYGFVDIGGSDSIYVYGGTVRSAVGGLVGGEAFLFSMVNESVTLDTLTMSKGISSSGEQSVFTGNLIVDGTLVGGKGTPVYYRTATNVWKQLGGVDFEGNNYAEMPSSSSEWGVKDSSAENKLFYVDSVGAIHPATDIDSTHLGMDQIYEGMVSRGLGSGAGISDSSAFVLTADSATAYITPSRLTDSTNAVRDWVVAQNYSAATDSTFEWIQANDSASVGDMHVLGKITLGGSTLFDSSGVPYFSVDSTIIADDVWDWVLAAGLTDSLANIRSDMGSGTGSFLNISISGYPAITDSANLVAGDGITLSQSSKDITVAVDTSQYNLIGVNPSANSVAYWYADDSLGYVSTVDTADLSMDNIYEGMTARGLGAGSSADSTFKLISADDATSEIGTSSLPFDSVFSNTSSSRAFRTTFRNHRPLVTFIKDDGDSSEYTRDLGVFNAQGIVGCAAIIGELIGVSATAMTWAQVDSLRAYGWEIMGHGETNLTTLTTAQVEADFLAQLDSASAHGIELKNYAYPNGATNDSIKILASKYWKSARGITYDLNKKHLDTYDLKARSLETGNLATWLTLLDTARNNNSWVIFYHHRRNVNVDTLNMLIDSIQARGVDIVTVEQALSDFENAADYGPFTQISNYGIKTDTIYTNGIRTATGGNLLIESNPAGANGANLAIGPSAGSSLLTTRGGSATLASRNMVMGSTAGDAITTGYENVAIGYGSLSADTSGYRNIAIGTYALNKILSGYSNTAIGDQAGFQKRTGNYSIYIGAASGYFDSTGTGNTFIGYQAGDSTNALGNTFVGYQAGFGNRSGERSVAIGYQAGYYEKTGGRLYIDNSNTTTPLIYGNFSNDSLVVNGTLRATGNVSTAGSGTFASLSVTNADTSAFTGTETRKAVYFAGATTASVYIATPRMSSEASPSANDILAVYAKADSAIVTRPESGTSGLKFNLLRVR